MTYLSSPLHQIKGKVQHYAWGGRQYIADLFNINNDELKPFAEYWLGIHPSGIAELVPQNEASKLVTLTEFIAQKQLPPPKYLFKVLDVDAMLSIQVHPTPEQAQRGFDLEEAKGIKRTAFNRNYKDRQAKPEMMLALSDFWLLHGISDLPSILQKIDEYSSLSPLYNMLSSHGVKKAFQWLLQDDQTDDEFLSMQRQFIREIQDKRSDFDKYRHEYWMLRWLEANPTEYRGLLSVLLMNLVKLQKGEAIFQPAGLLHAYLEGQNIEVMSNSDNVLRAGLTPKHVDLDELLKIGQFNPTQVNDFCLSRHMFKEGHRRFQAPFDDFTLDEIELSHGDEPLTLELPPSSLLFCLSGGVSCANHDGELGVLKSGEAAFTESTSKITFCGMESTTRIYICANK